MAVTITKANFETEVLQSEKPVLIDFWAPWCGPCRMLSPILDEIAAEHPEITLGKINVDEEVELSMQYRIMSIPAVMLFKNGEVAATSIGLRPKEEMEKLLNA